MWAKNYLPTGMYLSRIAYRSGTEHRHQSWYPTEFLVPCRKSYCGFGSAWIAIYFASWIRIRDRDLHERMWFGKTLALELLRRIRNSDPA